MAAWLRGCCVQGLGPCQLRFFLHATAQVWATGGGSADPWQRVSSGGGKRSSFSANQAATIVVAAPASKAPSMADENVNEVRRNRPPGTPWHRR